MKANVYGVQNVDYVSKKTGEQVKGINLHCLCKDSQVVGEAAITVFLSDRLGISEAYSIQPGMQVDVEYNSRGYVCGLSICD